MVIHDEKTETYTIEGKSIRFTRCIQTKMDRIIASYVESLCYGRLYQDQRDVNILTKSFRSKKSADILFHLDINGQVDLTERYYFSIGLGNRPIELKNIYINGGSRFMLPILSNGTYSAIEKLIATMINEWSVIMYSLGSIDAFHHTVQFQLDPPNSATVRAGYTISVTSNYINPIYNRLYGKKNIAIRPDTMEWGCITLVVCAKPDSTTGIRIETVLYDFGTEMRRILADKR